MSILIDSSTWIDIAEQVSAHNILIRFSNEKVITISDMMNILFGKEELFTCDRIRSEIEKFFIMKNYKPRTVSPRIEYALKSQVQELTDTNIPDDLKHLIGDESLSQDKEIFLSGKGEDIDTIVTQNERDFSIIHRKYCKFYNPEIRKCLKNHINMFYTTKIFSKRKFIKESFSKKLSTKFNKILNKSFK